jgi:hypothetical protein
MAIIGLGGLFTALLTAALADEIKAWMPQVIKRIIRRAVEQLPVSQRERYGEEWRSYVSEAPGQIGLLLRALGLLLAAPKMASILKMGLAAESSTTKHVPGPAVSVTASVTLRSLRVSAEGHVKEEPSS